MPTDRDPEQRAVDQYRECLLGVAGFERDEMFGPLFNTFVALAKDTCRTPADDARFPGLEKAVAAQGADSCKRIDAALKALDKRHAAHQLEVKDYRDSGLSMPLGFDFGSGAGKATLERTGGDRGLSLLRAGFVAGLQYKLVDSVGWPLFSVGATAEYLIYAYAVDGGVFSTSDGFARVNTWVSAGY